jgi:pyruvate ferredoxin oxidoreductase gamma subunit
MLAIAAFEDGRHAQAFPTFGSERAGAPVTSFCRIDERAIRIREPIAAPDALLVQDPTLLHQVDLFAGAGDDAYFLINSSKRFDEVGIEEFVRSLRPERAATVPATEIAKRELGRPLPNTSLLGAFAAITGLVSLEAVGKAIEQKFSGEVAARNRAAAEAAFDHVRAEVGAEVSEAAHA